MKYSLNSGSFQTGNTFFNLLPGDYTVTVKDANGCTTLSNIVKVTSAAIEPKAAWGLLVSPNPSAGLFQIAAQNALPDGPLRATLYDPSGRLLRNFVWEIRSGRLDIALDLSDLPIGLYTLWLTDGKDWGAVQLGVAR